MWLPTGFILTVGQELQPNGNYLVSNNGRFIAVMQDDGNFVVSCGYPDSDENPLQIVQAWTMGTGDGNSTFFLQNNGTVNINRSDGTNAWQSPLPVVDHDLYYPYCILQDDGLLCIYETIPGGTLSTIGSYGALWFSDTNNIKLNNGVACTSEIDYRGLCLTAIGAIPNAGGVMELLASALWPQASAWSQVKDEVEALIQQAFDDNTWRTVNANLQDRQSDLANYTNAYNTWNDSKIDVNLANLVTVFLDVKGNFDTNFANYKLEGFEILLLPLLAQYATLHLSLYRDGIINGVAWGQTAAAIEWQSQLDPSAAPTSFNAFHTLYTSFINSWQKKCGYWENDATQYRYFRLNVLDARNNWQFLDPSGQIPQVISPTFSTEIYSDVYGGLGGPTLCPAGLYPLTFIDVFSSSNPVSLISSIYISGSQIGYGNDTPNDAVGPDGQSSLSLIKTVQAGNPITSVNFSMTQSGDGRAGWSVINSIQFGYEDGTLSPILGQYLKSDNMGDFGVTGHALLHYPGYVLSSISANNGPNFGGQSGLVFGFMSKTAYSQLEGAQLTISNPTDPRNGAAWLMLDGRLRGIQNATMWAEIFTPNTAINLPNVFNCGYTLYDDITTSPLIEFFLVRDQDGAVYFIIDGEKRRVTGTAFNNFNFYTGPNVMTGEPNVEDYSYLSDAFVKIFEGLPQGKQIGQ